jgi:hypothetical protein
MFSSYNSEMWLAQETQFFFILAVHLFDTKKLISVTKLDYPDN